MALLQKAVGFRIQETDSKLQNKKRLDRCSSPLKIAETVMVGLGVQLHIPEHHRNMSLQIEPNVTAEVPSCFFAQQDLPAVFMMRSLLLTESGNCSTCTKPVLRVFSWTKIRTNKNCLGGSILPILYPCTHSRSQGLKILAKNSWLRQSYFSVCCNDVKQRIHACEFNSCAKWTSVSEILQAQRNFLLLLQRLNK